MSKSKTALSKNPSANRSKMAGGVLNTIKLRLYTLFKIPMINYVKPVIVNVDDKESHIVLPLTHRTKNHINSMYFGSLSVGADLCVGLIGMHYIDKTKSKRSPTQTKLIPKGSKTPKKPVLIFKDFKINFIKKAKADVHFFCKEGDKINALINKVIKTKKRQNATINGYATTPKLSGDSPIAEFSLTLSIK